MTFELDGAVFGHVVRDADFRQSQTEADIWKEGKKIVKKFESLFEVRFGLLPTRK